MKTLGVIGGLGPMATAYFLQLVTQMSDAKTDQDHMEIIMLSKPSIPDRTKYIIGQSADNPVGEMILAGKKLKEDGADLIAIPCITAHYFHDELEKEMASFYTEGLVEKETRKFCKQHKGEVEFEKANYGYNINFVNMIQDRLCASGYEIIFSESDYIRDIARYISEYKATLEQKKQNLNVIEEIAKSFPIDMQSKVSRRMKTIVLQDGNALAVKAKLRDFKFVPNRNIEQLDVSNEKEL